MCAHNSVKDVILFLFFSLLWTLWAQKQNKKRLSRSKRYIKKSHISTFCLNFHQEQFYSSLWAN